MNSLRTQELARKLALDFTAFQLELERAKRPSTEIAVITEKSWAVHRLIQSKRYRIAFSLAKEIVDLCDEFKTRREKEALIIVRLRNHAGEVVRGLK